jgi:23S rRNA pseudouridine2604 synthase
MSDEALVRLSKRLAELGLCSRREADVWIAKGAVEVDGQTVDQLGSKVTRYQTVRLLPQASQGQEQKVTILYHKPLGIVSAQAEKGYRDAASMISSGTHWTQDRSTTRFRRDHLIGLAAAGRLDSDSSGLLVLTQDGRIARHLIGEDSDIDKEYLVRVEGELIPSGIDLLRHGLSLDDQPLKPAKVGWLNHDQLVFILHQGKKRQIRRMCEMVGLKVTGLKRVRIGKVKLAGLPKGQWRYLLPDETF